MNSKHKKELRSFVPPELIAQVDAAAAAAGMNRSEWICALLEREINKKRLPRHTQDFIPYKSAVTFMQTIGEIKTTLTWLKNQVRKGNLETINIDELNQAIALSSTVHKAVLKAMLKQEKLEPDDLQEDRQPQET
jgi:hypothetical protein